MARQALVRVHPDGSLDPTFGDGWRRPLRHRQRGWTGPGRRRADRGGSGGGTFELRRFLADGAADPIFGGAYRSDVEPFQTESSTAVMVQPNGRILHGGYVSRDTSHYTATGQYDTDWVIERVSLR